MTDYAKNIKKYKKISQNRLRRSGFMKIPLHELNRNLQDRDKENEITTINRSYCIRDREVPDHGLTNPYHIPPHDLVFGGEVFKRNVKKVPFVMSEPRTICDIDETFYKIVEGRPLRQYCDVKVYMTDIRNITLNKANAAYLKDQMVQIDNSYAYENEEYNKLYKLYVKTKENFVSFSKESYKIAQRAQERAEAKAQELKAVQEKLDSFSFEFVRIRNEVGNLVAIFETLHTYSKFLYKAAPLSWRTIHEEEFQEYNYYFEKIGKELAASNMSFDIYQNNITVLKNFQPRLYFKKPFQLLKIFDFISNQCLNYMQIDVFTDNILRTVLKSKDYLRQLATEEIAEMQEMIEISTRELKWIEEQEVIFKAKFEHVLNTEFYELYASYDSSKLFTCVQYVNSRIFNNPDDPKDSVYVLMQQLENLYISLTSDLDNLNQEVVHSATNEFFAQDLKMMKTAYLAQRQLRECNILSKALFSSFEPPKYKKIIKKEADKSKSKLQL